MGTRSAVGVPQSVVFETVDPRFTTKWILFGTVSAVLAIAMGIGGYLLGASHGHSGTIAGPSASSVRTGITGGNPASPNGFMGTAIVGGKAITGGQVVSGASNEISFSVPAGWQAQYDPTTPGDLRWAIDPYLCAGRGTGNCRRGLVVADSRALVGSWTTARALVIGMGELRYVDQLGVKAAPDVPPVKQQALTLDGRPGYLALWHVPLLSSAAGVPDSYCGVMTVTPSPKARTLPVLQICLDDSQSAPALATMDQIANSVQVNANP